jgi:hypothetical protein
MKQLTRTSPANYTPILAILVGASMLLLLTACGDSTPITLPTTTATVPPTATTGSSTTVPATTAPTTIAPTTAATTTAPAKTTPVSTTPIKTKVDSPFDLRINQIAQVEPDNLEIKFLRVLEDSRCPTNVNCAWSGQAIIEVAVSKNGQSIGNFKLNTIEAYRNAQIKTFDDYSLVLSKVAPGRIYDNFGTPNSKISDIKPEDYVVTLLLRKVPTGIAPLETVKAQSGNAFDLQINQTALIESDNIEIKFLRVLEDTRCPVSSDSTMGISCYASGPVKIEVAVTKNGQPLGTFNLSSSEAYNNKNKKLFENYALTLVKVTPERILLDTTPSSLKTREIKPEDYVVSLLAIKLT